MPIAKAVSENKIAHAIATHGRMATSKWRHTVRIKDLFIDNASHEAVDALCNRVVSEIKRAPSHLKALGTTKKGQTSRRISSNNWRTLAMASMRS